MVTIATDKLSVTLGGRRVLHDVSVTLTPGSLVGVLGPNGAGKSTLARALLGLVRTQGRVTIDGRADLRAAEIARRVAYLPQGQVLHWPLSVERVVALGRLPHLAPLSRMGDDDRAAVEAAMARVDVVRLRSRDATTLSGGERARVLLARALAQGGTALVVDEPLAALDPRHGLEVAALLRAEAEAGTLVVAVLHNLGLAARMCDRLLLLDEGRLVADGSPVEVLTPANLAAVFGIRAWFGESAEGPMIVPVGVRGDPPH
ncbi:ABC transporter [Sphingomonas sp. Leaf407]|uniref:ABC transporter ATP-binding protein n=1 Tax=unclassified Sphingomonas TaxID=196159 RepID=UPI0006FDA96A|nr:MULTISPECIES: ABC transporter ATP-binding protein [unclassified Sphingomonas]KQN37093.1 ABC transporter [Sphingomonas sp. Leaf42]KQT30520.1 ABC transporter [Sphingomonas sp. Leaf407]